MKIAVDAMGGDNAPRVVIEGAVQAAQEHDIQIILVGDEERIKSELSGYQTEGLAIDIKHAPQVVGMDESPVKAIKKKRGSSIRVCLELVRSGDAVAAVSAGNSGAAMAAGIFLLKKLNGVDRPAILISIPTIKDQAVLIDAGGNVDCKPFHLLQFALMGEVYSRDILKKERPKVGLLSNGEEEGKGNELTRETHELLKRSKLNYLGYIEGGDVYKGNVDVIVCDGFVGNIVLKLSEGLVEMILDMLKKEVLNDLKDKLDNNLVKEMVGRFKHKIDYAEYGGAPLLGVDGICIISHGGSNAKAIKNAILRAKKYAELGVNKHLLERLNMNEDLRKSADTRLRA